MSSNPKGFMEKHGAALIDAGYYIIPIKRGEKRPLFSEWTHIKADHDLLNEWLDQGYGRHGIGIIAADTPAVDLDIRDEEVAAHMEEWVHDNIAMAPVRVGHAPKRLLMFRTDEPFRKLKSKVFVDEFDDEHHVEILGDGQQFVAYHIHPDTDKPYQWLYKDGPLVTDHADLPKLTDEAARSIIEEFERVAEERGWKPKRKSSALATVSRNKIADDVFAADTPITDISEDELYAKLLMVPGADEYDTWLQVGMALYHQFNGDERGLEWWHEWSSTADNYDPDALDDKWPTFNADNKRRAPVTARLIIKLAKEHAEELATEALTEITTEIAEAPTIEDLKKVAAKVKRIEFDAPTREQIIDFLRKRFKAITGATLGIKVARDMVRYEADEAKDTPRWLKDWVYVSADDKFFNLKSLSIVTQTAFNSTYSRYMLTKKDVSEGRAHPERLPAHVALNIHQVPIVSSRLYMPGMDDLFTMNGVHYANVYTDRNVPEVPDELTKKDRQNIEIVKSHFTHLFPDEREARIFLDYIAYIVQNPGKRPGWAVVIQGTEGDGKTFFGVMLGMVLGSENVRMLNAKTVQGDFNGWAEGQQVVFVEEIRLHGHNRYDVLNQIKPLITNDVIEIHRKGVDPYNIPNTSSYILATNFRDALPLTENDSRYFVLFSRFQTKLALNAFKTRDPDYYTRLYRAIEESAGAIRGWLLNHEFGPDFTTGNRAPDSRAKGYMAMLAKPEDQQAVEDLLDTSLHWGISRELLSATDLVEAMFDADLDEIPQTKKLNKLLTDMGFTKLGKFRVGGRYRLFWSQNPERFTRNGEVCSDAIREWFECDL
jgi:hypothetical protein